MGRGIEVLLPRGGSREGRQVWVVVEKGQERLRGGQVGPWMETRHRLELERSLPGGAWALQQPVLEGTQQLGVVCRERRAGGWAGRKRRGPR